MKMRDEARRMNSAGRLIVLVIALVGCISPTGIAAERAWSGGFCNRPEVESVPDTRGLNVRLRLDHYRVPPGGKLRLRVENGDTEAVEYSEPYTLARRTNGAWVRVRTSPFFSPRFTVEPQRAGPCQIVDIPLKPAHGLYRVSKKVWAAADSRVSVNVEARFQVG
jgi:hypothetical protein